jgi:Ala-tRNA(Pro) deacylase
MNVAEFLDERNVKFDILPHREEYSAQRIAESLHISGKEVAKTVLLRANGGFRYFVAVLPATKSIDLAAASTALGGSRVQLATEVEISSHCPDCEFGVLPPFGSQYAMKTIMDESLLPNEDIVFEGNTHHEAIRMKVSEFCRIENPLILRLAN